ncbi:MAG TPA: hypothetical protein VMZ29_09220 [Candidatus Bathyarchaeia archaeon]|nr:hypothetical protein [Candidatus Bathyarchaeia archaeon]
MRKRIIDKISKNLAIRSINIGRLFRGEQDVLLTNDRIEGLKQVAEAISDISEIIEILDKVKR